MKVGFIRTITSNGMTIFSSALDMKIFFIDNEKNVSLTIKESQKIGGIVSYDINSDSCDPSYYIKFEDTSELKISNPLGLVHDCFCSII
jgi:hypothetical protein